MTNDTGSTLSHLDCSRCDRRLNADEAVNLCPCGGVLLARYHLDRARLTLNRRGLQARPKSMWRYAEVLPVRRRDNVIDLGEGGTPLRRTGQSTAPDFSHLYLKDESLNPTGSFKARGMAAAVSRMKELGVTRGIAPTAGNAGIAFAAYAAAAGIEARVVVPADAPSAFVRNYRLLGADVVEVEGTITEAGREAARAVAEEGFFDVSTLKEPYRAEGKKTMGYELWEAMGGVPDVVVYPTGGGTGLIGMWKAWDELEGMGLMGKERPRLIAVQADGCAPVARAFHDGSAATSPFPDPTTLAAGLRVPAPYAGREVLAALRASNGNVVTVSDAAIKSATLRLARTEGIAAAPEAGATLAALRPLLDDGLIGRDERIVLFLTGGAGVYLDVLVD